MISAASKKTEKCLAPNCGSFASHRGLCRNCYSSAMRHVARGKFTWAELIELGLALDCRTFPPNAFTAALEAAASDRLRGKPAVQKPSKQKPACK